MAGEIIASDQAFKVSHRRKAEDEAASIKLSQRSVQQIENRIDKASAPQAAMVYGILRDKERLDAGEPTEIVASYRRQDLVRIEDLAAGLSQTLLQGG